MAGAGVYLDVRYKLGKRATAYRKIPAVKWRGNMETKTAGQVAQIVPKGYIDKEVAFSGLLPVTVD